MHLGEYRWTEGNVKGGTPLKSPLKGVTPLLTPQNGVKDNFCRVRLHLNKCQGTGDVLES